VAETSPKTREPLQHPGKRNFWRHWQALQHHLGIDSIRNRYLLAAGLFVVFILIAGWLAQNLVNRDASQSTLNNQERGQITRLLNDLTDDIWLAETVLQSYLLSPEKKSRVAARDAFAHLQADIAEVSVSPWAQRDRARQERMRTLKANVDILMRETERLLDIRSKSEKMFPAMPILIHRMLPHHIEFLTLSNLAMDEAMQHRDAPGQTEIHQHFSEARYAWAIMTGAWRIFIANRFGLFPGDPEEGMKNQRDQIEFYRAAVVRHLAALTRLEKQQRLEFQQSESLAKMHLAMQDWYSGYQMASTIYTSERWRLDLPLLRDTIRPLMAQIWLDLGVLRSEIESTSTSDITSLNQTADKLSEALWIILLMTLALTGAGYLFFERTIRRPIAEVAEGLQAEAQGHSPSKLRHASTTETRALIEAFDHMREQVRSRQQRLQTVLDNAAEGILTFDKTGTIETCNLAAERLFGWTESEARHMNIRELLRQDSSQDNDTYLQKFLAGMYDGLIGTEGEVFGLRKNDQPFPMAIKISAVDLDGRRLYTALVADISDRKAMIQHLRDMAEHDDLTGLYNRSFFLHELERVVERVRRNHHACILLYIDLDNFKYVNDTLGHLAGDRLLVEVSQLLRARARRGDLLARLGGDEFTMLLYDTPPEEALSLADTFRRALSELRFWQGTQQVDLACSIGAAVIDSDSRSAQEILSRADFACHLAKRKGRNCVHVFDSSDEMNVAALSTDMGWARRIKDAIAQNHFVLAAQPVVETRTGLVASYEILLRLRDDNGQIIMPSGFLPAAERFGLAADLDRWVISHALRNLRERQQDNPGLCYSINLSGQSMSLPEIADHVISEVQYHNLNPASLMFEVTETTAIANIANAEQFLRRLSAIGCRTALDDFGSGMSSFAYLRDLPVDYVKIDGKFVKNMTENAMDQAMVRAMNDIAHAVGKRTVAEFVETEQCLVQLQAYGVDYVQGYHLGKPELLGAESAVGTTSKVVFLHKR
jgi:diguanylate cyclase (GGDEF)-like protein/PAS domain S-box-containing protein